MIMNKSVARRPVQHLQYLLLERHQHLPRLLLSHQLKVSATVIDIVHVDVGNTEPAFKQSTDTHG